ncbi:MAG: tandem-95 repeat protein [Pedosphaera sp.]|nr:tandem-95 repeat protein [Pedosphaera sp.]
MCSRGQVTWAFCVVIRESQKLKIVMKTNERSFIGSANRRSGSAPNAPSRAQCEPREASGRLLFARLATNLSLGKGRFGLLVALVVLTVMAMGQGVASAQTIRLISAPGKFYVDDKSGNGIVYNYAGYTVSNNTAGTLPSVYVAITNIVSTNRITLSSIDSGARALGALAPGEVKMVAFYLKGPGFTGNSDTLTGLTNEIHTIRVLNGPPSVGSVLTFANFSYTNIIYVQEALANKVTIITNLNPYAVLGSQVALVIAGDTGTIGGENSLLFSPAVLGSWRPDCYEMNGALMNFTENPSYTNRLYFDPSISGFTNFSGQSYTNTFYFRAVKPTGTNIAISPFAFIDSGSGTKHTAFTSLATSGGSNVIYSATNVVNIVNQTVTPNSYFAPGGIVTYSITFTNFSLNSSNITLDEIIDVLPGTPANATYIPGSATFNSSPLADPTIVGQALHWAMPFTIVTNSAAVLTFQATIPAPGGQYTNSVTALIGSTQIDSTADTTDYSPSRSVVTIVPVADLALGKTGPAAVVAAANFNYTLTVTNLGPSPLTGLSVTDSLPASVTFVSASSGGFLSGGQVIWTNLATVASNATSTLTVTVTAPANAANLTNTAAAGSPISDPNPTNNTAPPVFTAVTASADLRATKTGPTSISAGANFNYTITITNFGPSLATSLSVTDSLPAGVTFVSATPTATVNGSEVVWSLASLAANTGTNLTLTVTAPVAAASLTNFATVGGPVSDPNPTNNTSTPVTTGVTPSADVVVAKTAPANVNLGENIPYTVSVTNLGPSTASSLSVTDMLPASVTFVSASGGGVFSGGAVRWTNFSLAAGASTNFTLDVTAPGAVSTLTNVASGGGPVSDPNPTNNTTPPVLTGVGTSADLAVSKTSPASVNAGANFDYTITVTNLGPTAANSVTVTDALPASVTFVSASAGGALSGSQVVWSDIGSLAAGGTTNLTLTVTAPANGASLTNTASVGSPTPDPTATNNTTPPVFTTVTAVADLSVSKTGPAASPLPGANFNYTITVANAGPSLAASVTVTDALPANLTFVSASGGGVLSGSDVIWSNLGSLAAGASTNLTLTVTAPLSGSVTNSASVGGPTSDPNPTNNVTPPVTLTVSNLPPVAVDNSASTPKNVAISVPVLANDSDPNGDPLTIIAVNPTNGTAIISGTNVVFTPATNFSGTATVGYTISDGNGGTASALITVTVNNATPVANGDTFTTLEDTTLTIPAAGILTNDVDADGDALSALLVANVASGTLTLNANGSFTYTPDTNFSGSDFFTYRATDGTATSGVATVTINITPVNDAPLAVNDTTSTPEDVPVTIPVLANDSDPEGTPLTITGTSTTNGTAIVSGTNVVFTPSTNFNGTVVFSYTISDGTNTATANVTVTVAPVNDAPIAVNDSASTPEDVPVTIPVLANDSDPEGTPLTITGTSTTNGTAVISGTNVVFTPGTNFNGTAIFSYTISDGTNTATANVTVTVNAVDDAPVSVNDSYSTLKNIALNIAAPGVLGNDTDVETNALSALLVNNPTNGSLTLNANGSFLYTPASNYVGSDVFTYRAYDAGATGNVATVTINITATNTAPVANNDSYTTLEDTTLNIPVAGILTNDTDIDGDALTALLVANVTSGTLNLNANGSFSYTPSTNFNGSDFFTYRARDGQATGNVATVTMNITPVNDAPIAVNDSTNTLEDVSVTISVLVNDSDPEGTPLTITGTSTTNGTAVISGTNVVFTPSTNFNGTVVFTYTISDGTNSATANVTVTVTPVNDAPIAVNDTASTPEDVPVTIPVLTNDSDPEGTPLTITGTTTTNGTAVVSGTNVVFTPSTNFNGTVVFSYTISDGTNTATANVTITITPVNDSPIAVNDTASTPEDVPVTIPVLANDSDPEGTPLTITGTSTTNGTAIVSGTNVVFTPSTNFNGTVVFTYTISDGTNTATANVTVTVNAVNDAPVTVNDSYSTLKNIALNISAPGVLGNDTDVETNTLSALLVNNPTNGTLTLNANGSFLYTPASNYVGSDVFTYRAYDSGATGNTATVTITVLATNTPPTANAQSVSTPQNTAKAITLTGSDPDGNPLTFATVTSPANGTLSGLNTNTGAITYTPNASFIGTDSFTFRVNDGTTNSAPATVTINVGAQADLAVFKTGSATGGAGTNLSFSITVTNFGPSTASNVMVFDQLPASYTFVSAVPAAATVTNGLVTWPAFNLASLGSSNFSLTVTPGSGGVFTNIAFATNNTPDPNPTNNNGTATNSKVTTFVQPLADVAVLKSGPASVYSGSNVTYAITVTNRGPSTATNTVAADTLPAGATFSTASGSFTLSNNVVRWAAVDLAGGASTNYTITVIAPLTGNLTNIASATSSTPDPDPANNNGTSGTSRSSTSITPIADVAVGKSGPASVTPGQSFAYTISVTNLGPVVASGVAVQDLLPTNLTFVSASGGGVLASNVVTWPTIASLANGATTNFTLTVSAPATGSFTNIALAVSTTSDPNPTNNNGTASGSRVPSTVVPAPFGVLQGTNWLNPQTGLFEQRVTVTNTGASTVAAFRLLVGNINGTNGVPRTNVTLINATGTNVDLRPYVQYNSALNPGSNVTLILEFFVPDRKPFTNSLEVIAVLPSGAGTNAGAGVFIDRAFTDARFSPVRFVLEWTSIPGKTYTIIYSDVGPSGPWLVATPTVTAPANRVQWYDDGPPKTVSVPLSVTNRFYRVITNP